MTIFMTFKIRNVCGNIRRIGEKYYDFASIHCYEQYSVRESDTPVSLHCSGEGEAFSTAIDGWFHYSKIHSHVEASPERDYKDSLGISVGKCSTVK